MTFTAISKIRFPHSANPASLTPLEVAAAYHFPVDKATGKGYVGGIIELGGGFNPTQVAKYFTDNNLPVPTFVSVPVGGGSNTSDGPDGADGEVQLDMIVAGAIAAAATFRIYFCPNTDAGFLEALKLALTECNGVSISWGGPESSWTGAVMDQFAAAIKTGRAAGIPVFVAAGDSGSQDSSNAGNQVDFPASAPDSIGCGGTRLTVTPSGERATETVWDDSPTQSATGGGVSKHFPGRQVPDIAGNADPDSGYEVLIDGEAIVIGGTSAVAPLMLGLHALLWELNGGKGFDFLTLVATDGVCFDVTVGNNGGFRAGPGRDDTTGLGVPDGAKLLAVLNPTAVTTPPVTTSAPPLSTFPAAALQQLNSWAVSTGVLSTAQGAKEAP
ncbi:S53 family peptidase [Mycolicibacterium sphagni]|uniref:S53 family peptidase n=1 Tax=Mycolicibacterium sphagni TaxID=1786 RepID=UPI0021F29535|nr:S53 family peptidase [Mycolicibacterium sphagni]MCV7174892.1 S53 family peptidase [Mycolicibacterium sphagni]